MTLPLRLIKALIARATRTPSPCIPFDSATLSLGLYWRATDSHFLFAFGNDFTEFIVSQNAFPAGQFYLVTGTYDGSTFQLYVNGNLEAQRVQTKTMVYSATNTWTIGAESSNQRALGAPRTWNGVIDEVQAFNRALTLSEIQGIYAAGSLGQCRPSLSACLASPSGAVAWWSEDGNLLDLLGNDNPDAANAISFVPGKVGLGAQFGSGGYIDVPPHPSLANQQFTFSVWARPDGIGPNNDQFGSVLIENTVDGGAQQGQQRNNPQISEHEH